MDANSIADILLRSDDEFADFSNELAQGKMSIEDGQRTVAFLDPIVREARKEARMYPDPVAAYERIVEEKFKIAIKELMQSIATKS